MDLDLDPAGVPADRIVAVLCQLAALQTALAARLLEVPAPAAGVTEATGAADDQLLTVEETARRLRRSNKWIYRRVKTLPFARRLGPRSWVFSRQGLDKWLARQKA